MHRPRIRRRRTGSCGAAPIALVAPAAHQPADDLPAWLETLAQDLGAPLDRFALLTALDRARLTEARTSRCCARRSDEEVWAQAVAWHLAPAVLARPDRLGVVVGDDALAALPDLERLVRAGDYTVVVDALAAHVGAPGPSRAARQDAARPALARWAPHGPALAAA